MSLIAYIVPSTRTQSLLHRLVVANGGNVVAQRPLPYGSPLPDGADAELRGLGFTRTSEWTQSADGWRCAVERLK